jgi:EmrB/QacA subfamily drug resistance transporter
MTEATSTEGISPGLRTMMWIMVLGGVAPALDGTIVNVAIPAIGRSFQASVSTSQWTISGYVLAAGIVTPLSGWLTERLGAKKLWLSSLVIFMTCSILSGAAWNIESLIVFRVLQGGAAGIMLPVLMTALVGMAGKQKLGRMMNIASLPVVFVPILGPVIGGLIIGSLDWRWIFYVNVPICVTALWLAWRNMSIDGGPASNPRSLDVLGLVLLSPGLGLLIYGLSQAAGHDGFANRTVIVPLMAGAALTTAFVIHAVRRRERPLVNLRTLRIRSYACNVAILFSSGLSVFGALLLISLFYQELQGRSALMTGLLLGPQGLGMLACRSFTGKLTDRIGARPVIIGGLAVTVLGTLAFTQATAETAEWILAVSLFIRGVGLRALNVAVLAGAYEDVPRQDLPDASSMVRVIQQLGGAFGTAVLVVILTTSLTHTSAPAHAFDTAFWWSIGFVILALIPALLLPTMAKKLAPARQES